MAVAEMAALVYHKSNFCFRVSVYATRKHDSSIFYRTAVMSDRR